VALRVEAGRVGTSALFLLEEEACRASVLVCLAYAEAGQLAPSEGVDPRRLVVLCVGKIPIGSTAGGAAAARPKGIVGRGGCSNRRRLPRETHFPSSASAPIYLITGEPFSRPQFSRARSSFSRTPSHHVVSHVRPSARKRILAAPRSGEAWTRSSRRWLPFASRRGGRRGDHGAPHITSRGPRRLRVHRASC
jgi:hypothetical protein